jgi:hypothetical protein
MKICLTPIFGKISHIFLRTSIKLQIQKEKYSDRQCRVAGFSSSYLSFNFSLYSSELMNNERKTKSTSKMVCLSFWHQILGVLGIIRKPNTPFNSAQIFESFGDYFGDEEL